VIRRALVSCLLVGSLAGCTDYSQLAFRVDERLTFTSPRARQLVTLPMTITWTMRDFTVASPGTPPVDAEHGYFAVFIDQSPVKPGQSLKAVARGDRFCAVEPSCPSADYLAQRQVYVTTDLSVTLTRVLPLVTDDSVQLHDVNIVLLDTAGRRIGEHAWHHVFKLRKKRTAS
jgi:hypothetical protein